MERITLTPEEAADFLGLKRTKIYELVRQGKIPHIRPAGRLILFRRDTLTDWLEKQEKASISNC
ncbi:helix-turn-helix domain-containing protein [Paenibacillus alginolyticus]|uniref:helix-turn-helix domain-containing protein n=1 Tax=Paenibacillus alginolyticus TaxID=59839 RepID=UPI0003F6667F|nr:helix-turn-helix domain-containing protein [Paenibacillus alginolyticus]MCY9666712.1 helix-turn-helix domain-containing protein [Paenibacillus alginolyticus]